MGDTTLNFGDGDGFYSGGDQQGGFYNDPNQGGFSQEPLQPAPAQPSYGGGGGGGGSYGKQTITQPFGNDQFAGSMAAAPMNTGGGGFGGGGADPFGDDGEPPLLEELGINFSQIQAKTLSVLHPFSKTEESVMQETDLAGPLVFCLMFGATLLATGRVQFGYIYGVAMVGCIGLYSILNLMAPQGMTLGLTASVLGYCLLPMVALSAVGVVVSLKGTLGAVLSLCSAVWCSHSASKMFAAGLAMHDQRALVAYPCLLLYGVFAFITVF